MTSSRDGSSIGASPFHDGERAVQRRAGVGDRLEAAARNFIRDHMPEQHREFFAKLPTLLVGSLDAKRRPWASMLCGEPGFVYSPDERHLAIGVLPAPGDPLRDQLAAGAPLGLLGLEPHTRRRNRVNGTVVEVSERGFVVEVDQSFGNCPKYIQARTPRFVERGAAAGRVEEGGGLLAGAARALVGRSDTFFIASAAAGARGHAGAQGVDVSHRGGRPGFVRVGEEGGQSVLTVPDFTGNFLFNTLGNIATYPRAGLLFVDYESGDALQLTGAAEVVWDGSEVEAFAGAQRLMRVTVESSRWIPGVLPLRWSEPEEAPQLAATGSWGDEAAGGR